MKKKSSPIKKVLIALVILIVLLLGYSLVSGTELGSGAGGQSSLSSLIGETSFTGQATVSEASLANDDILRILGSVQTISLQDDIFADIAFQSLRDSRFEIPSPQRIGRDNPFLPIGYDLIFSNALVNEDGTPIVDEDDQETDSNSFFGR
jgi:hypothetical protein